MDSLPSLCINYIDQLSVFNILSAKYLISALNKRASVPVHGSIPSRVRKYYNLYPLNGPLSQTNAG
jgi:hypothetical protein